MSKISAGSVSSVPQDKLKEHAYDGIQEYDNPLPGWWKWMFVGSFVFSIFYLLYFHIGAPGRTIHDQYDREVAINTRLQFQDIGELEPTQETLVAYLHKPSWLKVGQVVFKTNCISCHGREGEGKVGPNLTDDYYKNLRNIEGIAKVIANGAGNGAMPAWSNRLHPNEIVLVSAYVASLRGTQPSSEGKPPEGSEIDPWPEPPPEEEAGAGEDKARDENLASK
jgi:cytochrome c oxidase cbb3-type subunit 3